VEEALEIKCQKPAVQQTTEKGEKKKIIFTQQKG